MESIKGFIFLDKELKKIEIDVLEGKKATIKLSGNYLSNVKKVGEFTSRFKNQYFSSKEQYKEGKRHHNIPDSLQKYEVVDGKVKSVSDK
jgi:hypothetical protein